MAVLSSIESCVYLIILLMFSIRIFNCSFRKNAILAFLLISIIVFLTYSIIAKTRSWKLLFIFALLASLLIPLLGSKILIKDAKMKQIIYLFILMYALNVVFSSCILFFIPKTLNTKMCTEFIPLTAILILSSIVCYTGLSERIKLVINWTSMKVKMLLLCTIMLCAFIICWVYHACNSPDTLANSKFIYFGCITLVWMIVLLSISYPILVLNSATNTYLKHLTRNYETQIANQAEHYTAIAKANFELRRFRHDFKNISLGVKALIADGKPDEAVEVLERIKNDIYGSTDFVLGFDTGNGIVDALLVDKQQKSAEANTVIKFEGSVPSNGIDATELCVIFGNTLDNAIEACQKINSKETKTIDVRCESGNGFMFIRISNPTNRDVTIINNTVETTKDNKQLHGFGIYSLNQTVKKHDGDLKLVCKNKKFVVDISMSLACV